MRLQEDGVDLVQAVRAEYPKIRTVLVSGAPRYPGEEMPAHAFVLKDGDAIRFVERIFELIQCPTDQLPCLV